MNRVLLDTSAYSAFFKGDRLLTSPLCFFLLLNLDGLKEQHPH